MVKKKSITITFIILLWIGLLSLKASLGTEKFPPISGEIYGQAVPGLLSLYINNKRVPFDKDYNFRTTVNLKAGQKYLTLVLNYEGIKIIKKYLVLRRPEVKKFKIVVPKEKIESAVKIKTFSYKRKLALQKQLKLRAEKSKREAEEKKWMVKVASPLFFENEFSENFSPEALAHALESDNWGFTLKAKPFTRDWVNEFLRQPNFYDLVRARGKTPTLTKRLKSLIEETKNYRNLSFSQLTDFQKKKIMFLNRLLLEALYPQAPRRSNWLIGEKTKKIPSAKKVCEYLYVWEFSEGKLLLVKESKGSYSAEIHIPVAREWLELKKISGKELRQIIGKPVITFKKNRK